MINSLPLPEHRVPPTSALRLEQSEPSRHDAAPTGSTTLNHVRGPASSEELEEMKAERAKLIAKLQKLQREIGDVELILLSAVPT